MAADLAGTVILTPFGSVRLTRTLFSRAFGLPRSAFYRPSERKPRVGDLRLVAAIKDVLATKPRYGYRQVTNRLRRNQVIVNNKRVLRLMRLHGLLAERLRRPKWRGSRSAHGDLPNLSRFVPTAP